MYFLLLYIFTKRTVKSPFKDLCHKLQLNCVKVVMPLCDKLLKPENAH